MSQELTKLTDEEYLKSVPAVLQKTPEEFAEFQEAYNSNVDSSGGINEFSTDRIRILAQSQQWQVPTISGEKKLEAIQGVILGYHDYRAYYADPDAGKVPPDCSSMDLVNGTGTPGGLCLKCPNAKFRDDDDTAQACRHMRHLYLLRGDAWLPEIVVLPPTSLKSFDKYNTNLLRFYGTPVHGVVTELTLEKAENPQKKVYSTAKFAPLAKLTREHRLAAATLGACNSNMLKAGRALRVIGPGENAQQIEGAASNVS